MLATELSRTVAAAGEDVHGVLLARSAAGDQAAFRALYERSAGRLYAIALRITRDRSVAETVLQETYARIWQNARRFDPAHGHALTWMIAICRHLAIDATRSRPREASFRPAEGPGSVEGDVGLPSAQRCLADLDEPARRAVLLAYREGLSYAELGAVLGMPAEAVKPWIGRALARMQQCLEDA